MLTTNATFIAFDERSKIKNWLPPGGVHQATFRSTYKDDFGRQILIFEITSPVEQEDEWYWARHGYRDQDMWKLFNQLQHWFGKEEYKKFRTEGGCDLEKYYGKEAQILIGLIDLGKPDLLRVIDDIAPPEVIEAGEQEIGEFEI
jgi:hypothetical protein